MSATHAQTAAIDQAFFNDLSRRPPTEHDAQPQPTEAAANAPRQKRIACVLCRKRKLKCDGQRPTCGTCKRLSHECAYDEVRKKSGPKRGYVKALEARLQQVETLLKTHESTDSNQNEPETSNIFLGDVQNHDMQTDPVSSAASMAADAFLFGSPAELAAAQHSSTGGTNASPGTDPFSWEMIGLGLDEPLPDRDVIEELTRVYFEKVHPFIPMIHRPRFMAALHLAPHMRPPICLRYIMWCLAASLTDKYEELQDHFYRRARKYVQIDEMKGHGEAITTLAHCQTWVLITCYEFKCMFFPRAWLSTGRAVRLGQMGNLHKLDGAGLDVKQVLLPPKDWTEREERRRTFWMCYNIDRYASIGTGWPMTIDERDITTNLPASEEAFEKSKPMATPSLDQALEPMGSSALSPTAGVCVMAYMFGRNLTHLHRPTSDEREDDLNGNFWKRHREMDDALLNIALGLPDGLRLPAGISDPNAVFMNMNIHTSTICLHQAAIYKAEKRRMPPHVSNESKLRCATAAAEIAGIMRLVSHMDMAAMNPFLSFCIYVAARVFVQYLKTRPDDQQMQSHLRFLLQAMRALKRRTPLSGSFLVQLDLELEGAGVLASFGGNKPSGPTSIPANTDAVNCSPIFEIRESQSATAQMNTYGNSGFSSNTAPMPPGQKPFSFPANMDVETSPYGFTPGSGSGSSAAMQLPSRQKTPNTSSSSQLHPEQAHFLPRSMRAENDQSDMDVTPEGSGEHDSLSSGTSQRDTSRHSSYTVPSEGMPTESSQQRSYSMNPTGLTPSAMFSSMGTSTGDEFGDMAAQFYNSASAVPGWDVSGAGMTGLTPLPDNGWMLEEGGWEGYVFSKQNG
ncbi:uncharacterized protein K452DRAFT_264324 [Aplosporella prunicola CBS 121167]|uniref:Zn(2)-C6 fungal-type domain-containing protein n=1 Tax=Aplosporella prunicola CBS 121167 TaxID=1176127 RepID=A0A6A6BS01_9PEZI|nr:uncharacterized protein K452DRAFT_264324 [Aplosporella prunicola CBS 121167]KAF2145361.1 hypothetical protein K452DRAFT_264324 [Aplosporella prunicola CBS 121167]